MHLVRHRTCRVCNSSALTPVINLGEQYLQGSFVYPGKEHPPIRKIQTSLVRCDPMRDEGACGLLQMEYTVPHDVLYSVYGYRSGTNNTMRNHLRGIVEEIMEMGKYLKPVRALDIGCNDGTLLKYYPDSFIKFGIDPSDIAQEIKLPINVVQGYFPSKELMSWAGDRAFDIITSIAMFYDLEDPIDFASEIKCILSPTGIWILEISYMPDMLRNNSYDTICHEHIEYYSLAIIEYILKQVGMKIINVLKNDINGGSFRCLATHADNSVYDNAEFQANIKRMRWAEFDMELDTEKPYAAFQERVNIHRRELRCLLNKLKEEGKRIHIYGASTKGNTLLQWCGINNTIIDYAADRNPDKFSAHTLGTNIPIISEAESKAMNPDYYLVLPWHFKKEFLERERAAIEAGTGFIFPLPEIEIIGGAVRS